MAVSKRLRMEVFRRDDHTCRYCGGRAPEAVITIDHVVPVALGGGDEPSNLVTACKDCNAGKSSIEPGSPTVVDVRADAVRWAQAMRLAADEEMNDASVWRDLCASVAEAWNEWSFYGEPAPLPDDWRESIRQFMKAGWAEPDLLADAVFTAMGAKQIGKWDKWRYFCGVVWRSLEARQERAKAILALEEAETPDYDPDEDWLR